MAQMTLIFSLNFSLITPTQNTMRNQLLAIGLSGATAACGTLMPPQPDMYTLCRDAATVCDDRLAHEQKTRIFRWVPDKTESHCGERDGKIVITLVGKIQEKCVVALEEIQKPTSTSPTFPIGSSASQN